MKTPSSYTTDNTRATNYNPSLQLVKSSNKNYVVVGDTLTYTITAKNNGDILLGSLPNAPIMIYDILSSSLEFVPGSIMINNVNQPLVKLGSGINIGTLGIGDITTVSFEAKVLSNSINPITNSAKASFGVQLPNDGPVELGSATSNKVLVTPELTSLDIVKIANKTTASLGDTITYTVTLTNNGSVDALNVIFTDLLPVGITLVDHTFTVNGTVINGVDLSIGVNIEDIVVGATTTVSYTVNVVSSNCSMKFINSVSASFNYMLPNREMGSATVGPTSTSTSEVDLSITNFKQISIENNFTIPCQKPSIESINTFTGDIEIVNSTVVQTLPGQSLEGQYLTDYKLIVNGILKLLVEYTACEPSQSVHSAHFNMPFSTFIILPDNYCLDSKIEIDSEIEDIYNNICNGRNLFVNTTALINVKILSCGC